MCMYIVQSLQARHLSRATNHANCISETRAGLPVTTTTTTVSTTAATATPRRRQQVRFDSNFKLSSVQDFLFFLHYLKVEFISMFFITSIFSFSNFFLYFFYLHWHGAIILEYKFFI